MKNTGSLEQVGNYCIRIAIKQEQGAYRTFAKLFANRSKGKLLQSELSIDIKNK